MNAHNTIRLRADDETIPLSSLQQLPPHLSSRVFSDTREFPLSHNPSPSVDPITDEIPSLSDLSHSAVEPDGEEDRIESTPGFWATVKWFIATHFSRHKLYRLQSMRFIWTIFLDLLCVYLVTFTFPITTRLMGVEFGAMIFILCLGRMSNAIEAGLPCLLIFCVLWSVGGYSLGNFLLDWQRWSVTLSFRNLIDLAGVMVGLAIGFFSHLGVFYSKQ